MRLGRPLEITAPWKPPQSPVGSIMKRFGEQRLLLAAQDLRNQSACGASTSSPVALFTVSM
jgi:hypothetical protein